MVWGAAPSPFGMAVVTATEYGMSGLGFADAETTIEQAFEDLANRWPNARFVRDDARSRADDRAGLRSRRAGRRTIRCGSC